MREGKRIRAVHFDVRVTASPLAHPRVGIIVPRYHSSAVDRNRLKRRLRELVRTRLLAVMPVLDVVIHVRLNAYAASFEALETDVARVAEYMSRSVLP